MTPSTEHDVAEREDNPPAARDDREKRDHRSRQGDIIVVACFVLAAFGLAIYTRHAEYHRGLTNTFGPAFMGEIEWVLLLAILGVMLSGYGVVGLVADLWRRNNVGLDVVIAVLPPIALVTSELLCLARVPIFMKGFERWTRENVDVDAIQNWLPSDGAAHADRTYDRDSLAALPPCFAQLKPWYIRFKNEPTEDCLTVELSWGSERASHRGVVVGPPNMALPLTPTTVRKAGCSEYRRAVGPGVYIVSRWY